MTENGAEFCWRQLFTYLFFGWFCHPWRHEFYRWKMAQKLLLCTLYTVMPYTIGLLWYGVNMNVGKTTRSYLKLFARAKELQKYTWHSDVTVPVLVLVARRRHAAMAAPMELLKFFLFRLCRQYITNQTHQSFSKTKTFIRIFSCQIVSVSL